MNYTEMVERVIKEQKRLKKELSSVFADVSEFAGSLRYELNYFEKMVSILFYRTRREGKGNPFVGVFGERGLDYKLVESAFYRYITGMFYQNEIPTPKTGESRQRIFFHVPSIRICYQRLRLKSHRKTFLNSEIPDTTSGVKRAFLRYFVLSFLEEREVKRCLKENNISPEKLDSMLNLIVKELKQKEIIYFDNIRKNIIEGAFYLLRRKAGLRVEKIPRFFSGVYYGYTFSCSFPYMINKVDHFSFQYGLENIYYAFLQEILEFCREDKVFKKEVIGNLPQVVGTGAGYLPPQIKPEWVVLLARWNEGVNEALSNAEFVRERVLSQVDKLFFSRIEKTDQAFVLFTAASLVPQLSFLWERQKEKLKNSRTPQERRLRVLANILEEGLAAFQARKLISPPRAAEDTKRKTQTKRVIL